MKKFYILIAFFVVHAWNWRDPFGMEQRRLSNVNNDIKEIMHKYYAPGLCAALYYDGELRFTVKAGKDRAGNDIDEHTLFQVASLSKPITACIAVKFFLDNGLDVNESLRKNGLLDDLKIDVNLKDAEASEEDKNNFLDSLTLIGLLRHDQGFVFGGLHGYFYHEKLPINLKESLECSGVCAQDYPHSPPLSMDQKPGIGHQYSNMSYGLVGYVIEKAYERVKGSKKQFFEIAEEVILKPLGMNSTTFYYLPQDKLSEENGPIDMNYLSSEIKEKLDKGKIAEGNAVNARELREKIEDVVPIQGGWLNFGCWPAISLVSTVDDYGKFLKEIQKAGSGKNDFFSANAMRILFERNSDLCQKSSIRCQAPIGRVEVNGKRNDLFAHNGSSLGYRSYFDFSPVLNKSEFDFLDGYFAGKGIIIFTNTCFMDTRAESKDSEIDYKYFTNVHFDPKETTDFITEIEKKLWSYY